MDRTSLKFRALVNSSYNLAAYAWPLILTFFLTPFVVFTLGVKEYGIYLFISTVGLFINIIDLGLGMAVTKHIAFYFGEKKEAELRTLIRTANSLFVGLASVGFIAYATVAFVGTNFLPDRFAEYAPYSPLFLIAGLIFFIDTASRTYSGILTGLQRYDTLAKLGMTLTTISSIGTLIVVALGGGIYGIFFLQLAIVLATSIVMVIKSLKYLPLAKIRFGWNVAEIRKCYSFGLASTVHGMSGLTLLHLDKLIIPFYVGPSNLTYYNMPGSIANKIPGVSGSVAGMLFPMASSLSGEANKERLRALYVRSLRLVTIASAAITVACISYAEPLLRYWLNEDFAERASLVLIILALTNFVLSLSGLMSNFLLGIGRLKLLTIISFSTTVLNVVLLVLLLPRFGIVGAAWAYLLSLLPLIYLFYYCERYYLHLPQRKKYYAKHIFGTLLVSALVIAFNKIAVQPFLNNLFTVLAASGFSAVLYVGLYKLFGFFEDEDWNDLVQFLGEIMKKIKK